MDCSPPGFSKGFSRQEYWSGLPFPAPGDLPNPGIEPESLMSPDWQAGSLPLAPPGKPLFYVTYYVLASQKVRSVSFCKVVWENLNEYNS